METDIHETNGIEAEAQTVPEPEQGAPRRANAVERHRRKRRSQAGMIVISVLLVALGLALLLSSLGGTPLPGDLLTSVLAFGFGLSLLAYFIVTGRDTSAHLGRRHGLAFMGSLGVLSGMAFAFGASFLPPAISLVDLWPASLIVIGLALLMTYLITLHRERTLILSALAFAAAGFTGLIFTVGGMPDAFTALIAQAWPLLAVLTLLALLPVIVFRKG
jgi:hypothetical protein